MIHFHQSHSLTSLAHEFASRKKDEANSNALEPTWVIVQNNEIKEWLSLKFAERQGVAGNFKFIFPSEFLWTLYRLVRDDIPKALPSDLNAMQWALFDILSNEPDLVAHIPLSGGGEDTGFQLFYLSAQVADIFDQYQVYRPDMMQAWLNNESTSNHPDEQWQAILWRRLNEYWNSDNITSSIPSRAEAYSHLITWISEDKKELKAKLPGTLYVFGLSQMSTPFLNIIGHLGRLIKVEVFDREISLNSQNEEQENLFKGWSHSAQEQHTLFENLIAQTGADFTLHQIKAEEAGLPKIALNSCHSSRREVEVLKDAVLHYLNDNPTAGPEDVLVMVPDADEYASLLESAFLEEHPFLPISKVYSDQQLMEHTLVAVLDILNTSFKPSAVLAIMNLNPVKQVFGFSNDEVDVLEEWVADNHMYRGLGDSYSVLHSWKKGVTQILSGLAMHGDSLELYEELVPHPGIHSSDDMSLVARFSAFIHTLMEAAESAQKDRSPQEWLHFVDKLIHDLLERDLEDAATSGLYARLGKLKEQVGFSSGVNSVSFGLIKSWLKAQFENNRSTSGRFGQGITVSSYVPYRSIPFRFIAVLGMNEGVFPRKTIHPDFDLIYADPQPGDRIQKEDDSYLFLETLFAAKDRFHISYVGQDQHKDAELLPSVLAQQLKEVLPDREVDHWRHSLHGFSRKYFSGNSLPRSFSNGAREAAKNLDQNKGESTLFIDETFAPSDLNELDQVSINDLISFFIHPSKFIAHRYLHISDKIYLSEVSDREAFDLDGLGRYQLSEFLLDHLSAGYSKDSLYNYARSAALIPDKLKGEKVFEGQFQQVEALKETMDSLGADDPTQVDIHLSLAGIEIFGRIGGIHNNTLILSRIGRRKPIHEIEQWLKHLLLVESGYPIEKSVFISKEKTEIEVHELSTEHIPMGILKTYMQWFLDQNTALEKAAFFPETSQKYAEVFLKDGNEEKAISKARSTWEVSFHRTFVESTDYFNKLLWRNRDPLVWPIFRDHALTFWKPFLEVQEASQDG